MVAICKLACAKSQDFSEYELGGYVFKPLNLQSPQLNKDLGTALKWTFTKACEKQGGRHKFHKDTKMGI